MTAVTGAPMFRIDTIRGPLPGPTIAFVAGVNGGKRAAVLAVQQLRLELRAPEDARVGAGEGAPESASAGADAGPLIRGTVLLVPVADVAGAAAGLATTNPIDGLNLNRVFPGRADGSHAEQLAHRMMVELVAQSDFLVDLHGSDGDEMVGAFAYAARPGVDARIDSAALRLASDWGAPLVVWDSAGPRTLATSRFLQTAAHLSGVPAITVFETGRTRDDSAATAAFVRGARRLLALRGMLAEETGDRPGPSIYGRREVAAADEPGRWEPATEPGRRIARGELLGRFVGSSGVPRDVRAPTAGITLHVRRAGEVSAGTSLTILAVSP